MKKIIVFLIFIAFVFGVYYVKDLNEDQSTAFSYFDDFDTMDESFWYVGGWKTMFEAYDQAKLNNGILKLEIDELDKAPIVLSKPLNVADDQVLSVKRRVRINPTDEPFFGGFALIETEDVGLVPSILNGNSSVIGDGVVLIEYAYGTGMSSKRPGRNTIRVLPRTWMIEAQDLWMPKIFLKWFIGNFKLIKPISGEWMEEEIRFDNRTGVVTYSLNGQPYDVWTEKLQSNKIRVYMHGYGYNIGHSVEIDWIEINIE